MLDDAHKALVGELAERALHLLFRPQSVDPESELAERRLGDLSANGGVLAPLRRSREHGQREVDLRYRRDAHGGEQRLERLVLECAVHANRPPGACEEAI